MAREMKNRFRRTTVIVLFGPSLIILGGGSKGCLIKGCLNSTKNAEGGNSETRDSDGGNSENRDSEGRENPHWDSPRDRDSEVIDSEARDSEAKDSENGQIQGPFNSDTPCSLR